MVNDDRAKNRIYDGKFYEHLKKGYDIISQNVVDPSMIKTKPKDEYSTWDKVQMNATKSNLDFQGRSSSLGRSSLLGKGPEEIHTLNTDPNFMNSESTPMAHVRKGFQTSVNIIKKI